MPNKKKDVPDEAEILEAVDDVQSAKDVDELVDGEPKVQAMLNVDQGDSGDYENITVEEEIETAVFLIFTYKDFYFKVRDETFGKWIDSVNSMKAKPHKYTDDDIDSWKWVKIYSSCKTKHIHESEGKDLLKFAKIMFDFIFDGVEFNAKLITEDKERKKYYLFKTFKYLVRISKDGHDKFMLKLPNKLEKAKDKRLVHDKMRMYVQKSMKLKGSPAEKGEFDRYFDILYRQIFKQHVDEEYM